NRASNPSASAPLSQKPGMPEMNSRSPVRVANEGGGDLMPAGGAKCWIGGMGHLHERFGAVSLTRRCLAGKAAARRLRPADRFEGPSVSPVLQTRNSATRAPSK